MTKRTNAELLSEANERVARLRRVEAAKGDPRITQARKLAVALVVLGKEEADDRCGLMAEHLNAMADAWVEEFFAAPDPDIETQARD